jgi:guanylate kinase
MNKKIVCILGFTGSGKNIVLDSILEYVSKYDDLKRKIGRLVYHTTRDKRDNEVDGVDYIFENYKSCSEIYGKYNTDTLVELREYHTMNDDKSSVFYYTLDTDIESSKYDILLTTASPNQYEAYKARYGNDVVGVFIESPTKTRMLRVLDSRYNTDKDCFELCRRILDEIDEFNSVFCDDVLLSDIRKYTNDENTDIEVLFKSILKHVISPLILAQ